MSAEFLNRLPISDEERAKLSSLGASSPLALLLMRQASRDAFDAHLGRDRAEDIAAELEKSLTPEELESLRRPAKGVGKIGARLDPPPISPKK
jgi:hypothetical protein